MRRALIFIFTLFASFNTFSSCEGIKRCEEFKVVDYIFDSVRFYKIYILNSGDEHLFLYIDSNQYQSIETNFNYSTVDLIIGEKYILCVKQANYFDDETISFSPRNPIRKRWKNYSGLVFTTNDFQFNTVLERRLSDTVEISNRKPIRIH